MVQRYLEELVGFCLLLSHQEWAGCTALFSQPHSASWNWQLYPCSSSTQTPWMLTSLWAMSPAQWFHSFSFSGAPPFSMSQTGACWASCLLCVLGKYMQWVCKFNLCRLQCTRSVPYIAAQHLGCPVACLKAPVDFWGWVSDRSSPGWCSYQLLCQSWT